MESYSDGRKKLEASQVRSRGIHGKGSEERETKSVDWGVVNVQYLGSGPMMSKWLTHYDSDGQIWSAESCNV